MACSDYHRKIAKESHRRAVRNLSDSYIKEQLRRNGISEATEQVIELKRQALIMRRNLKDVREAIEAEDVMPTRGLYQRGKVWWCCYADWSGTLRRESTRTKDERKALAFFKNRKKEADKTDLEAVKQSIDRTSLRGQLVLAKIHVAILERKIKEADYNEPNHANAIRQ